MAVVKVEGIFTCLFGVLVLLLSLKVESMSSEVEIMDMTSFQGWLTKKVLTFDFLFLVWNFDCSALVHLFILIQL
jgi:hypothetical protein